MRKTLKKGLHYFSILSVLLWSTGFALPNPLVGVAVAAPVAQQIEEISGPTEPEVQLVEEPVQSLLQVEVQVEEQEVEEPVEINTQSNTGGNTCFGDSCGDDPVYVKAYKIVCSDESYLPNWGDGSPISQITESTASDFLDSVNNPTSDHQNCWLEKDWQFQWGFDAVSKFNGDYYGPAPTGDGYNEWKNFDTLSDVNGLAMVTIPWDEDMDETKYLWVREALQEGYLPFSQNNDLQNAYSAEIYCNVDVLNYDNYDRVDYLEPGSTYWCVAINVLLPNEGPQCGNGELEDGEQCDDGNTADGDGCSANCTIEEPSYDPYCGDGIRNQEWEMCDGYDFGGPQSLGGQECNQYCQIPSNECSDLVLAKINSDSILNTGDGNVTDDIYLGAGDYVIPNNVWFPLYWLGSYIMDGDIASYEDVPGLAVQRLAGSLRTVLYGTGDELTDIEHLGGDIMFYNASVNSVSNDPSNDKPGLNNMEKGFDGTTGPAAYPLNDEAQIVSDSQVDYWMTVQLADDGFYSHWSIIEDCREDGYDPYCGDGLVNQDWEQCDPGLDKGEGRCNQYCQYPTDECSDLVLARVNTEGIYNANDGDMSSDVYLGASDYVIPSGAWFALFWSGHAVDGGYYLDADVAGYEDVPGYAIQRSTNNVRLVMHGTNETAEDIEHSNGSVELYNATVNGQINDTSNDYPGYNTVEEPFNGTGVGEYNTVNDELWVSDSTHSNFWLTTGRADDGFYTRWTITEDCREDEPTLGPWCSILVGVWKQANETGIYNQIADMDNDQDVDIIDWTMIVNLYSVADNDTCYDQFDDPEFGYQYGCADYQTIGWCQGVWQGLVDYMGTQEGDLNWSPLFDLYEDGIINTLDLAIFAQYMPDGEKGEYDQVGCLNLLVPPLAVPQCVDPEEPGNPGGSGVNHPARIENLDDQFSCTEHYINWNTSRPALTWITYGADQNLGNEFKGDTYQMNHNVSLPDLAPGATYFYKIHILDSLGLTGESEIFSFTTPTTQSCGTASQPTPEEGNGTGGQQPEQQVLGVKEIACNWHRPSGSSGIDSDVQGVQNYADGSLIRGCNTPEVYMLRSRMKWHIPNWEYLHNHYEGQRIYNIPEEVKNQIPDWTGDVAGIKFYAEGTLLKGPDGAVYVITGNGLKHIKNLTELSQYAGQPIIPVSEDVLFAYKQL